MIPAVKHTFWARLAASHKEQMSPIMILVLSRYKKMQKNGFIKSFENIYLKACSIRFFSRAQGSSLLIFTLKSFHGYWRSAAAVAHDLIFVEVTCKWQFVVVIIHANILSRKWFFPFKQNWYFSTISLFYVKFKESYCKKKTLKLNKNQMK